jgi:hypothetical protein
MLYNTQRPNARILELDAGCFQNGIVLVTRRGVPSHSPPLIVRGKNEYTPTAVTVSSTLYSLATSGTSSQTSPMGMTHGKGYGSLTLAHRAGHR